MDLRMNNYVRVGVFFATSVWVYFEGNKLVPIKERRIISECF